MLITSIILVAIILIGFNVWNTLNLRSISKRPLRNDNLNDSKYWELKYKMQYMITVFAVILFVAGYFGITTLNNAKDSVRREFQLSMDSMSLKVDSFKSKLFNYTAAAENQFQRMDSIGRILDLLGIKQKEVSTYISGTYKSAQDLDKRVQELMRNDQIRQNMYVIDDVVYKMPNDNAEYQKYFFKDLRTINGNPLPNFTRAPYLIGLSKEGSDLRINDITSESFELMVFSYSGDRDMKKPILVTIIVVENK
ncbi:MAG TPA: hypothetical protein VIZ28_04715 [Chitinophagaceae bacterium]